jgi:SEC-C motif-containing protein
MKTAYQPVKINFFTFLLRLIPATLFVILFFYLISPFFINGHLKLFKNQLRLMHPEYEILSHDIIKINQLDYIQFFIKVNKTPTLAESSVKKGAIIKVKGQASTLCIAPIIIFSLILAWPGLVLRKRLKAILIAIPITLMSSAMDYPMMFIADIESVFSDAPLTNSIRLLWKHLMNNGGRQFLALLACLFAIAIVNVKPKIKIDWGKVGRNDPCPCGSGKKYKNCCLLLKAT